MDPEVWRWIWLATAAMFVVGEIAMTGAFFLLPFGVGATAATAIAFTGADPVWQWLAFVLVSVASFGAMRPMPDGWNGTATRSAWVLAASSAKPVSWSRTSPRTRNGWELSASAARNGTPKPPKATTCPPEPPSGWS